MQKVVSETKRLSKLVSKRESEAKALNMRNADTIEKQKKKEEALVAAQKECAQLNSAMQTKGEEIRVLREQIEWLEETLDQTRMEKAELQVLKKEEPAQPWASEMDGDMDEQSMRQVAKQVRKSLVSISGEPWASEMDGDMDGDMDEQSMRQFAKQMRNSLVSLSGKESVVNAGKALDVDITLREADELLADLDQGDMDQQNEVQ
eukprot:gene28875-35866_t